MTDGNEAPKGRPWHEQPASPELLRLMNRLRDEASLRRQKAGPGLPNHAREDKASQRAAGPRHPG